MRRQRSTSERGYGSEHQREREKYRAAVDAGAEHCRRCRRWIPPGGRGPCPACGKNHLNWDLGHHDRDRRVWTGPEHMCCNRATATRRKRIVAMVQTLLSDQPLARTTREW